MYLGKELPPDSLHVCIPLYVHGVCVCVREREREREKRRRRRRRSRKGEDEKGVMSI